MGDQERYTELYLQFIAKYAAPKAMVRNEIANETERDTESKLSKDAIRLDMWDDKRIQGFKKLQNEFSVADDGIILRGSRIFLPQNLRRKAVKLAHEAHQGVEKTKALLREKVWFPNMDT